MATLADARRYHRDLTRLSRQVTTIVLRLWRRVDRGDISDSWLRLLPDAAAAVVAGQTVAAEMADPYLTRQLVDAGLDHPRIAPDGFVGPMGGEPPVEDLLYLPAIDAKQRIATGASPRGALRLAEIPLAMYARTVVTDAGRLSTAAGMGARPHTSGFYRMLQPPSCSRCAILAGKHFRYNTGFQRHPRCDCVHIPVREADDSLAFDPRKAIEAGQVTGLSKAELRAIVEFGADPAQVVNARRGMYLAGGRKFTTTGTTRRGIAGARILARDLERALGRDVAGRTFRNVTFDRLKALEYAELLRRGKTFTRVTRTGRVQTYSYRFARTPRPTPEQILADARSRDEAIRLLVNNGYII